MKRISIIIYFTTLVSLGLARSTILDLLKDGIDTHFVYESREEEILSNETVTKEIYTANIFIQKATDVKQFGMYLRNVQYESKNIEKESSTNDLVAMELPVIAAVDTEFGLDYVMALPNDTNKSLDLKDSVLDLLIANFTEIISVLPEILIDIPVKSAITPELQEMPLGKCKMIVSFVKTKEYYIHTTKTTRSDCEEPVKFEESAFNNPTSDSVISTTYYYDVETLKFARAEKLMMLKESSNPDHMYLLESTIQFKGQKPVENFINEQELTKKYTALELSTLVD